LIVSNEQPYFLYITITVQEKLDALACGEFPLIMLTFDLRDSDFPYHSAFPLFIDNAMAWLSRERLALRRAPGVIDVPIPADHLVQGENTLAVEVHQSGNASSDIAFSLALLTSPCAPTVLLRRRARRPLLRRRSPKQHQNAAVPRARLMMNVASAAAAHPI